MLLAACLAACGGSQGHDGAQNTTAPHDALNARVTAPGIGLFTSLPILWAEADGPGELLAGGQARHWLRDALPPPDLAPLDVLADADGRLPLPPGGTLIMAQPRPLAAVENVALDAWVRGGGHLLLFADPMLTAHSRFAIGDPRRPQDIVLLSPILAHWGLELQFPEDQPAGKHSATVAGKDVPVDLPGRFAAIGENPGCRIEDAGLLADCVIGKGHVLAVADAAMLDDSADSGERTRRWNGIRALLARVTTPR